MMIFKSDGCSLNKFLISFNLILCIVMLVLSILPKVQQGIIMHVLLILVL